jgi:hypothetical protein
MKFLERRNLRSRQMEWFALFALIVIPLGTFLFGTRRSPFDHTFSYIGNSAGYKMLFIIWGIITGLMITFLVIRLYILHSFKDVRARRLLIWSLIFLVLTVMLPSIETIPVLYKIHTILAVSFALSLLLSLILFIQYLYAVHQKIFSWPMFMIIFIFAGTVLIYYTFGNTGIFELFFFFTLTIFLLLLSKFGKDGSNHIRNGK